jgi:hypothetical protein
LFNVPLSHATRREVQPASAALLCRPCEACVCMMPSRVCQGFGVYGSSRLSCVCDATGSLTAQLAACFPARHQRQDGCFYPCLRC